MPHSKFVSLENGKITFVNNNDKECHIQAENDKIVCYNNFQTNCNLYVNGTIKCRNNLVLNSSSDPVSNGCLLIRQHPNNIAEDNFTESGNVQSGEDNRIILLDPLHISDNYYKNWYIKLVNTSNNFSIYEKVIEYQGSVKTIIFNLSVNINVNQFNKYYLYGKSYNSILYNENRREFMFSGAGNTLNGHGTIKIYNTLNIHANNATFDGEVEARDFTSLSDYRLKKDIDNVDCNEISHIIDSLDVVDYMWKDQEKFDSNIHIGLIAQDVEKNSSFNCKN